MEEKEKSWNTKRSKIQKWKGMIVEKENDFEWEKAKK
jgi:hypothetical protein